MKKLKLIKIILKDSSGKHYRIFSVSNAKDKNGEYYIKVIFPDMKDVPLLGHVNDYRGKIISSDLVKNGILEFTYHYYVGASHYKRKPKKFVDVKRHLPVTADQPAIHLLRLNLYSLNSFELYEESKISNNDYIIPTSFNGDPRSFEIFISTDLNVKIISTSSTKYIDLYKIDLEDNHITLFITDSYWVKKAIGPFSAIELFRYDDP